MKMIEKILDLLCQGKGTVGIAHELNLSKADWATIDRIRDWLYVETPGEAPRRPEQVVWRKKLRLTPRQ
jgi:hypothetical protein